MSEPTYYVVFAPDGNAITSTLESLRKDSVKKASLFFGAPWIEINQFGYTIRKVKIIPVNNDNDAK